MNADEARKRTLETSTGYHSIWDSVTQIINDTAKLYAKLAITDLNRGIETASAHGVDSTGCNMYPFNFLWRDNRVGGVGKSGDELTVKEFFQNEIQKLNLPDEKFDHVKKFIRINMEHFWSLMMNDIREEFESRGFKVSIPDFDNRPTGENCIRISWAEAEHR